MRPLTVGAGVINGILLLLFAKIDDITIDVSDVTVADVDAKDETEELMSVAFVTATSTRCRSAAEAPDVGTVVFPEVFRKQLDAPVATLE